MDGVREIIAEVNPEAMLMDGFDDCIIGMCDRFGSQPIVAYDYDKVIEKLIKDGMSGEDAVEFHAYNQLGAYVGESTPCFIRALGEEKPRTSKRPGSTGRFRPYRQPTGSARKTYQEQQEKEKKRRA